MEIVNAWQDSLGKFWNVDIVCDNDDCDNIVPVIVGSPEEAEGWICNDCDKKINPEDYE